MPTQQILPGVTTTEQITAQCPEINTSLNTADPAGPMEQCLHLLIVLKLQEKVKE